MKPVSEACLRNQEPIREVLEKELANSTSVLELGSGTGQHAVHFARAMPHLTWQATDLEDCLPGIRLWYEEAGLANLLAPMVLDATDTWPDLPLYDAVFTANTIHFVSGYIARCLLEGAAQRLNSTGKLCIYGPFNINGHFTSESNARFNDWLKARDPQSGIKDLSTITDCLTPFGLELEEQYQMPANNFLLVFSRTA